MTRERMLRWAVVLAALAAVGFGLYRGEMNVYFQKAEAVCLECIGIG